jgi:hypothetical protein
MKTVPYLRLSAAGFALLRAGFNPRTVVAEVVMNKVAKGHVIIKIFVTLLKIS